MSESDGGFSGLEAVNVSVRYGGVVANQEVSLSVAPKSIVGLIGPNGAGKTSFLDALTGFTPSSGTVRLGGARVDDMPPHARQRAGMARTWQAGELFSSLSVLDNVRVGAEAAGWSSMFRDLLRRGRSSREIALQTLALVGLDRYANRSTDDVSLGQQRLVGVARALAAGPQVVLLDEPAAGLDTRESRALGTQLRQVASTGPALLLVDHDMELIFDVCDFVYVLDFGRIIASGTQDDVRSNKAVVEAYLGAHATLEKD